MRQWFTMAHATLQGKKFMNKAYDQAKLTVMQDLKKRVENIFKYHARQKKLSKI